VIGDLTSSNLLTSVGTASTSAGLSAKQGRLPLRSVRVRLRRDRLAEDPAVPVRSNRRGQLRSEIGRSIARECPPSRLPLEWVPSADNAFGPCGHQETVAGRLDDPAAMAGDLRVGHLGAERLELAEPPFLVGLDQARIFITRRR
jgi:hypothetical protein